jgi:hypothetical protein
MQNLPKTDENLIAFAPWFHANCTQSYMTSARGDPIRGFIFYLPNYLYDEPPSVSSEEWDLSDNGEWRYQNEYPIFAVAKSTGQEMMGNLSLYSGNMTDVPDGHELADLYGAQNYARIHTTISAGNGSGLPSLWLFLLVVIGALVVSLLATSCAMHWILRRRRASLRRRIQSGEVDLELLGIKRLTVPVEIIEKMPLYLYACDQRSSVAFTFKDNQPNQMNPKDLRVSVLSAPPDYLEHTSCSDGDIHSETDPSSTDYTVRISTSSAHLYAPVSQPTCAICLEDFISHETVIRELFCGHIYHPDCIDSFLSNNSSLCPMCKKSALPLGYCPEKITNAMVRRERMLRRLRSRVNAEGDVEMGIDKLALRVGQWGRRLRNIPRRPAPAALRTITVDDVPMTVIQNDEDIETSQRISRQQVIQERIREHLAEQPVALGEANETNRRRESNCEQLPFCRYGLGN